jgi:nicotinamidase/pyrazinamidase
MAGTYIRAEGRKGNATVRRALLIVDVQPTFCEGGELPVAGGNLVAERVAGYLTERRGEYALVATSQDWHSEPGEHFSDNPDYLHSWPPHGIVGTANAELHPSLVLALGEHGADVSVKKGLYSAAYSAFEGHDAAGRPLIESLTEAGIDAVDVCGIAESHCVRATALDALGSGLAVRLLTDLTVPVTPAGGEAARAAIEAAGGQLAVSA